MLKIAYAFFMGILLAIFVGMGIAAFYPQPASPEYPQEQIGYVNKELSAEQQKIQNAYDKQQKAWEEKMKPYNRNVSIIAIVIAIIFVALGLFLADKKFGFASDGLVMGGIFTLLYGLGRGFASQNSKYSFLIAAIGVAIVFVLGYLRFFDGHQSELAAKKIN